MKKLFVFSDAHSFFDELMKALEDAGFDRADEDHVIVSLGDLCDRGSQSRQILSFINDMPRDRKICVIGNHEILMDDLIARGFPYGYDISNGTVKTAADISEPGEDISSLRYNAAWNEYRKSWQWYLETDKCLFVHGWIPCGHSYFSFLSEDYRYDLKWREASDKEFTDASWVNGMDAWRHGVTEEGKTIYCGHWHTSWGHHYLHDEGPEFPEEGDPRIPALFGPFIDDGIVALDGCTAFSGQVNVVALEIGDDDWQRAVRKRKGLNQN